MTIFFGDKTSIDSYESNYVADETGNSKVKYIDFDFKDTSNIILICFDLINEINKLIYLINSDTHSIPGCGEWRVTFSLELRVITQTMS